MDNTKVVILDDDPTGTQTVSGVQVILAPSMAAYAAFFAGGERAVYILTNSRALPQAQAVALVRAIKREVEQAAAAAGCRVTFVLRGDSTLRGHIFAEIDVMAEPDSVSLFVPAFPEGGRVTVNGIHYLEVGGVRTPVNRTEFAQDATFGYRSERLADYVAEVGQGRPAVIVPLRELRSEGAEAVRRALVEAPAGACVIPEAETRADLEIAARGLEEAERQGRHVVVRSASTFAAIRAGLHGAELRTVELAERVLVVCGSHTEASTRQLARLAAATAEPVVLPTDRLMAEGAVGLVRELSARIIGELAQRKVAILATERVRQAKYGDLAAGARVMDALNAIVRTVAPYCDGVIAKGGITSAQVATDGLGATTAFVAGQLAPGVSLWRIGLPDGRTIPYAVIPGNVGQDGTMADVAARFGVPLQARDGQQAAPAGGSAAAPVSVSAAVPTGRSAATSARRSGAPSAGRNAAAPLLAPIKRESIVAEVTRRLMDYLLSGTIRPGERIPAERVLSEALGIGRSTLREALKTLTVLGLLEARLGDGTYLKRADSELLPQVIEWGLLLGEKRTQDLIEARQKIEVIVAGLAAERHEPHELEALRQILARMETADDSYKDFVEADIAFHMQVAEMARNTALRDILKGIRTLQRAWITSVVQSAGSTTFSYVEHVRIYEALARRDAGAAAAAMEVHMRSAGSRLSRAQANAPIFGEGDDTP